ncbi:sugar nucleotide-binding protein [Hanstruepera marina]|uniref:sugar nucleotide-binding protein n=1 Tax=Hanstruepera marina TaxID=2873265 RepID=UPI001CA6768C|nr:sugar nucleotide-binding protein [Hanstruepera marina]
MKEISNKHRILIFGASGFIGYAIYKELCGYFKTFGTYRTPKQEFVKNKQFIHYNVEEDDTYEILDLVKPTIIISALRGDFNAQIIAHSHMVEYMKLHKTKMLFLSSANVFDAYSKYPSYENDKTYSNSVYGYFKIKLENMLMRLPKRQVAILRLPMVLGKHSPRVEEIKTLLKAKEPIEVFPNLIMNVTSDFKVTQQIHYIINRSKYGIYHLGSQDLVHHEEFIEEITHALHLGKAKFKRVFTTNDDRYLAVLPKDHLLPKHLQLQSKEVLKEIQL